MTANNDAAQVRADKFRTESIQVRLDNGNPPRHEDTQWLLDRLAATAEKADETKAVLDDAIDEVTRLKAALLTAQQERDEAMGKYDYALRHAQSYKRDWERAEATVTRLREALAWFNTPNPRKGWTTKAWREAREHVWAALADTEQETA